MVQLVDEAQVRTVVHLLRGTVGAARLFREFVQEQIQQARLVDDPQLGKELDFGIEVHGARSSGAMPGRNRWAWWW